MREGAGPPLRSVQAVQAWGSHTNVVAVSVPAEDRTAKEWLLVGERLGRWARADQVAVPKDGIDA